MPSFRPAWCTGPSLRLPVFTTSILCLICCMGQEQCVYGNSAYAGHKDLIHSKAPKAKDFTNQRTKKAGGEIDERRKSRNKSPIRASRTFYAKHLAPSTQLFAHSTHRLSRCTPSVQLRQLRMLCWLR